MLVVVHYYRVHKARALLPVGAKETKGLTLGLQTANLLRLGVQDFAAWERGQ